MAITNNKNIIAYVGSDGNVYPFTGSSGFVNVSIQDSLPQTYDITYVHLADVAPSAYVSGSINQKKTMKQYNTDAGSSDRAKLTTFIYLDGTNSTTSALPTKIIETITTVN